MIELKSIKRASFLKSSLGLPRNIYLFPLLPSIVIFLGFASDFITSISSWKAVGTCVKFAYKLLPLAESYLE